MAGLIWVLLVEDEADHRALVKEALGRLAPSVPISEARSVEEARDWIERQASEPDSLNGGLVILDLGLPGAPGFDLLEWMRYDRPFQTVPVVVLTASENPLDAEHAFNLGAKGYFQKPSDFRQYLGIFKRVFHIAAEAEQPEVSGPTGGGA